MYSAKLITDDIKRIDRALNYLKKFEGTPRKSYNFDVPPTTDCEPFWIENKEPPDINYIKSRGLVCVGLGNLVRRFMSLQVPGNVTNKNYYWPGGTESWFSYLNDEKRLEPIDFNKIYPPGALLIQDFNPIDQGHICITLNSHEKGLLHTEIIHNISDKYFCGTFIHKLVDYPNYKRHTHICYPENWLLKN